MPRIKSADDTGPPWPITASWELSRIHGGSLDKGTRTYRAGSLMDLTGKATVEGLVVRGGSREPLKKARVTLQGRGRPLEALTGADGRFVIADVEPGQYMLSADRNGYIRQVYGEADQAETNIFLGPGTPLDLEPSEHRRDIVFELICAGVIIGRVLDEDLDPVPGAHVRAMHPVNMPGRPPVGSRQCYCE